MKKKTALILAIILIFNITVYAADEPIIGLMPGPATYTLSDASIELEAGGTSSYDFYLPFDSESITVVYSATENLNLNMLTSTSEETAELSADNSEVTYTFETVQRKGEYDFILETDNAVIIESIVFNKAKVQRYAAYTFVPSQLSEFDEKILSTVIIDMNANALLVRGGMRYIDYDDVTLSAEVISGRIYLPAHTLARALGYYVEDYPERHYLLLRNENTEFCFTDSLSYKEIFNGYDNPVKETIKNPLIYKNGKSYLPAREFAEAIGKTVGFREGIIVIDDKYTVEEILNDNTLFDYVKSKLSSFNIQNAFIGNTYYVDCENPLADDENPGTEEQPFLTISKAASVAEAGDRVLIGGGTYRETLTPAYSGTPTSPIVFEAMGDEKVVISALEEVGGFTAGDGGIYTAPLSWNLGKHRNQVFYNGKSLTEARYPNSPTITADEDDEAYDNSWPVKGDLNWHTNPNSSKYDDPQYVVSGTLLNQSQADCWKGGTFIGSFGYSYWLDSEEILGSETGKLKVNPRTTSADYGITYPDWCGWGYIVGHRNCMDTAGEWIVENGTLSLIPPVDADTSNLRVEVKKRQLVADLSGQSYIHLKNINTIGGSLLLKDSNMCVVNGCEILYNNHFLCLEDCDAGNKLANSVINSGENGIYATGVGNAFVNNNIYEAAGAAIIGAGTHMYIENNHIKNCGYAGSPIGSLHFPSGINPSQDALNELPSGSEPNVIVARGGHSIYSNTVERSGRSVMTHGCNTQAMFEFLPEEIAYNDFHDGMVISTDAGITYDNFAFMGTEKLKTKYHNNYIYYTLPDTNPFSFGIYHDGGAEFIDTYNNVVFTTHEDVCIESGGSNPGDNAVHTATANASWADCDNWNNISLTGITGGASSLAPNHFPDVKPFYAGAVRDGRYLKNYSIIVNDGAVTSDTYYVRDAYLGDGAQANGNAVYLEEGQSVTFTMDLGNMNANSFVIGFLGDKYDSASSYRLTIGNDSYDITLNSRAATTNQLNLVPVSTKIVNGHLATFRKYSGTQSVTLECTDGGKLGIVSIKPRKWGNK